MSFVVFVVECTGTNCYGVVVVRLISWKLYANIVVKTIV